MPVTITNLAVSAPVLVPLSTGTSVRLSPGQTSGELPDVEVANNPKVDKLREQRLIEVQQTEPEPAAEGGEPEDGTAAAEAAAPPARQPRTTPRKRTTPSR